MAEIFNQRYKLFLNSITFSSILQIEGDEQFGLWKT